MMPAFVAISISPTQKDMIPIIVMHSVIASLEESSAALVMSGMLSGECGVDDPKHHHTGPEIIEHKKTS